MCICTGGGIDTAAVRHCCVPRRRQQAVLGRPDSYPLQVTLYPIREQAVPGPTRRVGIQDYWEALGTAEGLPMSPGLCSVRGGTHSALYAGVTAAMTEDLV